MVSTASSPESGFARLDDALITARPSVLVVACKDEREPLMHHVARRLRGVGCTVVVVRHRTSIFRDTATQLGLGKLEIRPAEYAAALSRAAPRLAIVAPLPAEGSWDEAVAREVEAAGSVILVFMTPSSSSSWLASFDTTTRLTDGDKLRWLAAAVGDSAAVIRDRDLTDLESWWRATRPAIEAGALVKTAGDVLSARATDLATCLALAGRSLPISAFDTEDVDPLLLAELRSARVLTNDAALVFDPSFDPRALEASASDSARARTARALLRAHALERDPWGCARAAELLLLSAPSAASEAMDEAIRTANGSRLIIELDDAWFGVVKAAGVRTTQLLRGSAERVLAANQPKNAKRWLDLMDETDARQPRTRLLLAKAEAASGDLVRAAILLQEVGGGDIDDELRCEISVERGELALATGDHDAATTHANEAIALTKSPRTELAARSVLGKVLLAKGAWDAADAHFAADALTARGAGERTAELRSRLNRGIALLSKGLLDAARVAFAEVQEHAERWGESRAIAFALSNLGVVAYRQRDYAEALRCW